MTTLHMLGALLVIAAGFGWISSRWIKAPITLGSVLLAILSSLVLQAVSTRAPSLHAWAVRLVRQIHFDSLILHGMLPMLLFAGAFLLDLEYLVRERLLIALLSAPGTLLSTGAVAALMWVVLHLLGLHPQWLACLLFGALISPTDPIAVLEMLGRVNAPRYLQAQLAGESLFNDGVGAAVFLTLLSASSGAFPTAANIGWTLLWQVGGGVLLGILGAWLTSQLMRKTPSYQVEILLTLSLALGGYALAEVLHLSAPMEAVVAGISLRKLNRDRVQERMTIHNHRDEGIHHESIDRFWEVTDEIQNALLFVLLGLEVLSVPFARGDLGLGVLAILVVLAVRVGVVASMLGTARALARLRVVAPMRSRNSGRPPNRSYGSSLAALSWGGLRGGLGLALAFAAPPVSANRWILPTTYVVVVFSIAVQGWSMNLFLHRQRSRFLPNQENTAQEETPLS
ncbi:MAG: cation:proton antiporter [Acidobacteriota bacterium]